MTGLLPARTHSSSLPPPALALQEKRRRRGTRQASTDFAVECELPAVPFYAPAAGGEWICNGAAYSAEQAAVWQDLPLEHFQDADMWLHRTQMKAMYGISERSYFRWIDKLRAAGLVRSRPAQIDGKVKLFYRPDVDQAITRAAAIIPRRGRRAKAFAAPAAAPPAIVTSITQPDAITGAAIASLQAQQISLQKQHDVLANSLARIEASLAALAQPAVPQARVFDLLEKFASFNQLTPLLAKLANQINRLPDRLANKPIAKRKVKAKGKGKKLSKAKPKVKRLTKGQGKPIGKQPAKRKASRKVSAIKKKAAKKR